MFHAPILQGDEHRGWAFSHAALDAPDRPGAFPALLPFVALGAIERRVIAALRTLSAPGGVTTGDVLQSAAVTSALDALARECASCGLTISAPDSAFVGYHEIAIVTRLAEFQRPSQSSQWTLSNELLRTLKDCADALCAGKHRRLTLRPALPKAYLERFPCFDIEEGGRQASDSHGGARAVPDRWDGVTEPPSGSLAAKARAVVRSLPIATTAEFVEAGIGRNSLARLVKRGFVERIQHGRYRLPARCVEGESDTEK